MKIYSLAAVLFLFFFCTVRSQTILTLDQCIALARERSPHLRSTKNSIRAAELSQKEIGTTALPQIHLQATPSYAPYGTKFGYDPASTDGGEFAGQIVLQQSLYDGGIRSLRSEQLGVDLERTGQELRVADRDLRFSVKQSFFETLQSMEEARLESESVAQLGDYLVVVKRLYSGGSASYTDVLKTDLQLSNARLSYQKALDDFALAKFSLAELIGRTIDTAFTVQGSLGDTYTASTDSLLSLATNDSVRNAELAIGDMEVTSGLLGVEMTRHEAWPVIALSADVGYLSSGSNLKLAPDERVNGLGFGIGLVVDIPLINWGATNLRVQQQQLAVNNLQIENERLQRSISSEAKKASLQILRSRQRLETIRQSLSKAEENFVLTKSKFVGGGTLSLEVLAAQQLLTDTKLAELQALSDIQLQSAKLEQLTTR